MKTRRTGTITAGVLAVMATIAAPIYLKHEGNKNLPYKDIVGVWTVCAGDTRNVTPGVRLSDAECQARTETILTEYGTEVATAAPGIADYPYEWAAHTIFAANIGVSAYKKSTVLKLYREDKHRLSCRFIRNYKYAGGKPVIGLINRREGTEDKIGEYELCLADAVERDIEGK